MKNKFKIGDEIYYMKFDTPEKGIIKGIGIFYGEIQTLYNTIKQTEENPVIKYYTTPYTEVEEKNVFKTKEELINSVFSKLE